MSKHGGAQILGLDVIRLVAALLVMLHHLGFWMWSGAIKYNDGGHATSYHWLAPYGWFGWVGVEIFFVLSGFVIAYSANSVKAMDFAKSRIVRLYPTAWICATITFLFLFATRARPDSVHFLIGKWIYSLTLILADRRPIIDGSYWTLPVEIVFYTLVFLLLACGLFKWITPAMILLGCYSTAYCFLEFASSNNLIRSSVLTRAINASWPSWEAKMSLATFGMFFAIGSLIWSSLFKRSSTIKLCAIVVFLFGGTLEIVEHAKQINFDTNRNSTPLIPVFVWLASVLAMVLSVKSNGEIARSLGHRGAMITRRLGLMTYPLYLVHQQVGYALIFKLSARIPDVLALALVMIFVIALSFCVVTWLEKPLQRILRSLLHISRRSQATPAASVP